MTELNDIGDVFSEAAQTGLLANITNNTISSLQITPPEPEAIDLSGGIRATNETGNISIIFMKMTFKVQFAPFDKFF